MRTPTSPAKIAIETKDGLIAADQKTADVVAGIESGYTAERDLANQLLGQVQMANAFGKWTTVVYLSKLKQVRESKMYRALPAKNVLDENGQEIADCRLNTWDGYCRALGLSSNKVEEDLLNLQAFGEEAMASMGRIGIGYRELRQYRRLPEDQKTALIEVAKAGDKDAFVELAEEIITRHAKEKEALAQQLQSKDEVLAGKQKLVDLQAREIDGLAEKARFVAVATPTQKLEGIRTELLAHAAGIEGALAGKLRPSFAALKEHLAAHGGECDAYLSSALGQIERAVREIREDFGLLRAEDVAPWANAE